MNYKSLVVMSLVLSVAFLSTPFAVNAQTTALSQTLTVGSKGTQVKTQQQVLASLGFLNPPPTGYFGSATLEALKAFQASFSLEAVGLTGPQTRKLLNQLAAVGSVTTGDITLTTNPNTSVPTAVETVTQVPIGALPPTLTLATSKTSVMSGGSVTVTWSSKGVTACTASGSWDGALPLSGVRTVTGITSSKSYKISCTGTGGTIERTIAVSVTPVLTTTPTPVPATTPTVGADGVQINPIGLLPPTLTLTANKTSVISGGSVVLTWNSKSVTACTASGSWDGRVDLSGTRTFVNLTSPKFYSITCSGSQGTITRTIQVSVQSIETVPPTPVPTPTTTPPVIQPPVATTTPPVITSSLMGNYPTYAGCEAPSRTYTRTVYIDPVSGTSSGDGSQARPLQTLSSAIGAKKILEGDHVILMAGDHGAVQATMYNNPLLHNATTWTWFDFQQGATVQSFDIRNMTRWLITKAEITHGISGGGKLLYMTGSNQMVVADSSLYTVKDANSMNAANWLAASSGMQINGSYCTSLIRNKLTNVRHGIFVGGPGGANFSLKSLIQDNVIKNFSGDGMRPIGSDITISRNFIVDEYLSATDGDSNHDDGIQSYALNGAVFSNIVIDSNWVQETTNPNRLYNASMQGINSFDGVMSVQVTNNVVISSAYHGISWYGVKDSLIDHNTVINPSTNGHKTWIYVPNGKTGLPPSNVTVSNNTATRVMGASTGVTFTNNFPIATPYTSYMLIDPVANKYDLHPKVGSVFYGTTAGAQTMVGP